MKSQVEKALRFSAGILNKAGHRFELLADTISPHHSISPDIRETLLRNKELKNKRENVRKAFILATGPSIKQQDLGLLKNEFCISVSNFFVHPLFLDIAPEFHLFAPSHPPITKKQYGEWLQKAGEQLNLINSTVVMGIRDKEIQEERKCFLSDKVYFYEKNGDFPLDFTKPLPPFINVVHIAIYLAIYLGIEQIYLLGVDHNWINSFKKSQHFYDEKNHEMVKNNYDEWESVKDIGVTFSAYAHLWDIYRQIKKESDKMGVEIYNSTPDSMLDIFPYKKLEDVV